MTSFETIIRPFQQTTPAVRVPRSGSSEPYVVVEWQAGNPPAPTSTTAKPKSPTTPAEQAFLTGSFTLSTSVYNKKFPKEKKSTDTGFPGGFSIPPLVPPPIVGPPL